MNRLLYATTEIPTSLEEEKYSLEPDGDWYNVKSPAGKRMNENKLERTQAEQLKDQLEEQIPLRVPNSTIPPNAQLIMDDGGCVRVRETSWSVPRMWEGGETWIIGGGQSVPRLFGVPGDVIKEVEEKGAPTSIYSEHLSLLHNKNVIGINLACQLGDWLSAVYISACRVLGKHPVSAFRNLKVTSVNNRYHGKRVSEAHPNIKRLWLEEERPGLSFSSNIVHNENPGVAAISLAALTGAKRIMLLGYDCKPMENGRTSWGLNAKHYRSQNNINAFLQHFPPIAEDAKRHGIEILNVNPDSALPDFRKVKLEEVL